MQTPLMLTIWWHRSCGLHIPNPLLLHPAAPTGLAAPFPGPLTLRTALSYYADLLSSPHKDALEALAACAADRDEAERLRRMASHEGRQEYAEFIAKPHRSLLEVGGCAWVLP